MADYNFNAIEQKWQQYWAENKIFKAEDNSSKPKYYVLDMFPYPSGAGLHVGHPLGYIASDIVSRYKRHKGFNVLHPMGYDSFGLPAEQYAIQTGQHPAITTEQNIKTYRRQLDQIGFSFDWDREVRTSNPDYYKWTQWIFIQLFNSWYNKDADKAEDIATLKKKFAEGGSASVNAVCSEVKPFTAEEWEAMNKKERNLLLLNYRLAYLSETMVNWCPALGTVLANDEVKDGVSERGGHPVIQKKMQQWSMRITAYAERLLQGLDTIDWTESLKEIQRNWIGKSEGASLSFKIKNLSPALSKGEGAKKVNAPGYHTTDAKLWNLLIEKAKVMRSNPTPAEDALWQQLRAKNIDFKIRRQQIIDRFIVDFVCLDRKLVIEVDGDIHDYQKEEDAIRTSILEDLGYKVIRFRNERVLADTDNVLSEIKEALENRQSIKLSTEKSLPLGEVGGVISVFTTRPDTIFGVTYMTLAPEHELVSQITTDEQKAEVEAYIEASAKRSERDRMSDVKTISGAFTGAYAIHPFTGLEIPIWIGDYVLASYGTGAVMAVPAHDSRDYAFAKHFNLPIKEVVAGGNIEEESFDAKEGKIINSDFLNGLDVKDAIQLAITMLEERGFGKGKIQYKLRDAVFGRQRYWGEPIPIYYDNGVPYAVDEADLPITLPEVDKYLPTEDGEPPLARATDWKYKGKYDYELSTMPGWAGSSWYFLRYMNPENAEEFVSKQAADYWQQIDLYLGGAEHATGHLLYFRFWTKFLKDRGFISIDEPAKKLINQGMIMGMSAYAYRVTPLFVWGSDEDENNKNIPVILTSKTISHQIINKTISKEDEVEIIKKAKDIFIKLNPKKEFLDFGPLSVYPIPIDIKLVKNDELDTEDFIKNSRDEFKQTEFIFLEDGKFICSREVEKMSKSKYNVVNPDDIVAEYGADTLRMYEMFLGPLEDSKPWNTQGIEGVHKFLKKFWRLVQTAIETEKVSSLGGGLEEVTKEELKVLHETIKKIEWDIENFSFNTSISQFMIATNKLTELKCNKREILEPLVICLSPYAPHIAEELWRQLGHSESVEYAPFPKWNEEYLKEDNHKYPVSVNGKMRVMLELPADMAVPEIEREVLANDIVQKWLEGKTPKKVIIVPKKIVNVVV